MLAAALDGIERQLEPPAPLNNINVYELSLEERKTLGIKELPGSLYEALQELDRDDIVKSAIGPMAYEAFRRAKLAEWEEYRINVMDWEIKRYLEMV